MASELLLDTHCWFWAQLGLPQCVSELYLRRSIPPSRMLVATARVVGATLLTKDDQLIRTPADATAKAIEA